MEYQANAPPRCPYCGSIENNGSTCSWCHNKINDDESEDKKMTVELKFTGLSAELASALLRQAMRAGETEEQAANTPAVLPIQQPAVHIAAPVQTAPVIPPTAPGVPAVPVSAAVPVQQPAAVPAASPISAVPLAAPPTYDVEMLGRAAAPLAAQGKQQELFALLHSFGVQALTQLPPERYGEMALKLRELGAQI